MRCDTSMPGTPIADAVERLKNVFSEIPGTQLSLAEVSRLSGLEPERCQPLLDALISAGFLSRGRDGRFRRPAD